MSDQDSQSDKDLDSLRDAQQRLLAALVVSSPQPEEQEEGGMETAEVVETHDDWADDPLDTEGEDAPETATSEESEASDLEPEALPSATTKSPQKEEPQDLQSDAQSDTNTEGCITEKTPLDREVGGPGHRATTSLVEDDGLRIRSEAHKLVEAINHRHTHPDEPVPGDVREFEGFYEVFPFYKLEEPIRRDQLIHPSLGPARHAIFCDAVLKDRFRHAIVVSDDPQAEWILFLLPEHVRADVLAATIYEAHLNLAMHKARAGVEDYDLIQSAGVLAEYKNGLTAEAEGYLHLTQEMNLRMSSQINDLRKLLEDISVHSANIIQSSTTSLKNFVKSSQDSAQQKMDQLVRLIHTAAQTHDTALGASMAGSRGIGLTETRAPSVISESRPFSRESGAEDLRQVQASDSRPKEAIPAKTMEEQRRAIFQMMEKQRAKNKSIVRPKSPIPSVAPVQESSKRLSILTPSKASDKKVSLSASLKRKKGNEHGRDKRGE